MQGRYNEGIHFLKDTKKHWIQGEWLVIHTYWHLALFYLRMREYDKVLKLYDSCLDSSELALDVVDCASLLWRLKLHGVDVEHRWENLRKTAEQFFETHVTTFNDAHFMMVLCGSGDKSGQNAFLKRLQERDTNGIIDANGVNLTRTPFNIAITNKLCEAIHMFSNLQYAESLDLLMQVKQF
eukprot:TRINITY_DN12547_c0_g1_i2.p1 TRINITY_DN12547_c0_g1~~TRINITY_DN12547_c0_g1_i2.p1  ORF type:complete len:211 (-),score=70.81 TRINITY_DN12547_c0_g1_i2:10-555(-)